MTIRNDIRRIAGSLAVLGTELEQKGQKAFDVTLGWEQGPLPASPEAPDELCVCGHTAASHDHSRWSCRWVHEDPLYDSRACWCPSYEPAPVDPAASDRRGELREGARAAMRHAELKGLLRVLDAIVQRVFRILDAAVPPDMSELRNRRTGEFDPETAADALSAGWCPNCWQVDQAHVPLTKNKSGMRYYSDRCRPCGDFRKEHGIDKPRVIVAAHLEGRRLSPAEVDSAVAAARAALAPAKKKKGKKKNRRAA